MAELEEGVASGDANAKYLLGARLVAEPDSHDAVHKGIQLISEAAAGDHPEALAEVAAMEAIASWRPGSWDRAFDLLHRAAELGSDHARNQLRFLSGSAGSSLNDDWFAMRESINLEALLKIPERVLLAEQPRLHAIQGFANSAECEWIIERASKRLQRALVWTDGTEGARDPARTNRSMELRLTYIDVVIEVIRTRISEATRLPVQIFETPQVMHYTVGQEFRSHYDFLNPANPGEAADMSWRGQRIMTFLLVLNDGFHGGETAFPKVGLSWRGRRGDAIFFPNVTRNGRPDPMTLHAGMPPLSGEKWILSQWIRDRPPGRSPA